MSELREAYRKWSDRLDEILRDPTPEDLANLWPALPAHRPKPQHGDKITVGEYLDFTNMAYRAKQKYEIVRLLMEVEKGNGQA
jgi:hypothetical protein